MLKLRAPANALMFLALVLYCLLTVSVSAVSRKSAAEYAPNKPSRRAVDFRQGLGSDERSGEG